MFSVRALGRHVGAASLAGIIAGVLVAGVLGRVAMRVSGFLSRPELVGVATANGNRVGEITFSGTVGLALFIGIPAGILGAVLFASAEPWLRRVRPWQGVVFGLILLLAGGFIFIDPTNFDFQRFGSAAINVAMFAALFVAFGALTAWLFDRIRPAIEGNGTSARVLEVVAFERLSPPSRCRFCSSRRSAGWVTRRRCSYSQVSRSCRLSCGGVAWPR